MASADFDEDGTRDPVGQTAAAARPAPKSRSLSFQLPSARPLTSDYIGPESVRQQLDGGLAQPTALATDDFDEDGVPDLVSGYTGANGGLLTLHRGNVDAIYPHSPEARLRKAAGAFTDAPFLTPARIFEVPAAPDFLGAGDFDNDGHRDIVAAARGGSSLYFLPGDGEGGLGAARSVALGGQVTAMIAGEIDRKDNLADVVVGIDSEQGPAVLVFEGPEGALDSIPEVVALPAAPTALALGRLDDDVFFDLAVAAGQELMILHGRNSKPARRDPSRSGVGSAVLEEIVELESPIASIAIGRYVWDARDRQELALLSADGTLHLLVRGASPAGSTPQSSRNRETDPWRKIGERHVLAQPASGQLLVTARVSGLPLEELVILDRGASRLQVTFGEVLADRQAAGDERELGQPLSGDLDGAPVAALPMRLNRDALSDLVLLQEGMSAPTVAASATSAVITVDDMSDSGPVSGDGYCQLSEAIANANDNSDTSGGDCTAGNGADTIEFSVTSIDVFAGLPAMTDPGDSIDGTTACGTPPCVELRGNLTPTSGLTISASSVAVRGLVVTDFDVGVAVAEGGIFLTGGGDSIVEGNTIKNQVDGWGISIKDSASNTVGGTALEARNLIIENGAGMVIDADSQGLGSGNMVLGNYIGTDGTNPLGNDVYGINVGDAERQEIGGTATGAGNVISGNGLPHPPYDIKNGLLIHAYQPNWADGCIVQGNFIGLDASGTVAMSNEDGIRIWDVADTLVGGTAVGARNVISGNAVVGIIVRPYSLGDIYTTGNKVQGNYIGTDVSGTLPLGNGVGIELQGIDNLVGGTEPGAGNVISGNNSDGVLIFGATATGNQVQGNYIGTDASGTLDLGNAAHGVVVEDARNFSVGDMTPGAGNTIAFNGDTGVFVADTGSGAAWGRIVGNSVFSNALLGIDLAALGSAGVTANDVFPDADGLQNFPVVATANVSGSNVTLQGTLASTADTDFRIELFSSVVCDGTGNGEGQNFLGSLPVTTDGNGDVSFGPTVLSSVGVGRQITATATSTTLPGCPNGLCEPWDGENCLNCPLDCDGDQSGQPASQYCCGAFDAGATNSVDCSDSRCSDAGFVCRAPSGTSEFSACFASTCTVTTALGQTITAPDKDSLEWTTTADVRFVRGDLTGVSTYGTTGEGVLLEATSLDISADSPAAGTGLYYLVRPELCGSWQNDPTLPSEPDRDSNLP
jgi:parallel beta-helix repeat protein